VNLKSSNSLFKVVTDRMIRSRPDLEKSLHSVREALQKVFSSDTSFPGTAYICPSAGQCAAVAAIIYKEFGGNLVSAKVGNESHWFNRIPIRDKWFDIDLTGDQFGRPPIQVVVAGTLYPRTKLRHPDELNQETLERSLTLARRARLSNDGRTGRHTRVTQGDKARVSERKQTQASRSSHSTRQQGAKAA
jgi:hypothetical protein